MMALLAEDVGSASPPPGMTPTSERIRVAHVSLSLATGGMEKLLVEMAAHADLSRFDLSFLCLESRGALADRVEALGWPVQTLGKRPGVRPGLVLKLARIFRRLRPHIVHTHNEPGCIYAAPAARLAGVPVVLNTRHGRGTPLGERRTKLFAWSARCTDRVVCVSHDSAQFASEAGIAEKRLATIWNGIDVRRFAFVGPNPAGPAMVVARLAPEKDLTTLLAAVPQIVRSVPRWRLLIVGDGPCRSDLEQLAASMGLGAVVEFAGERHDVADLLAAASMFLLPSLTEGVSLALLEAMAVGLPAVATRVGGNGEVVYEEETGLLVPPKNPQALAEAVIRLAADTELAARFGEAARRRVEEHFDIRAMVRRYENLYQELLAEKNVRGIPSTV